MRIEAGRRTTFIQDLAQLSWLAALPLAGAIAGGWYDERHHLGFTNWRSSCQAAGFSFGSVVTFMFELLPTAVIGLLAGGLALQASGFALRRHRGHPDRCLAVHAGCALTMPAGMALCSLALPLHVMLVTDVLMAAVAASIVSRFFIRTATYTPGNLSVVDRISAHGRAPENSLRRRQPAKASA